MRVGRVCVKTGSTMFHQFRSYARPKSLKETSILWSIPDKASEVCKAITEDGSSKKSVIVLVNSVDTDLAQKLVESDNVEEVVFFTSFARKMFDDKFLRGNTVISTPLLGYLTERKNQDVNFKILSKERRAADLILSTKYKGVALELMDTNLYWYSALPSSQLHFIETQRKLGHTYMWPLHKISPIMKLKENDFRIYNPSVRERKMGSPLQSEDSSDVSLLKIEENSDIQTYLQTDEEQTRFFSFFLVVRQWPLKQRVSIILHELFPGCVDHLYESGFYINSFNKDLTFNDYLKMYLILSKLPGFQESVLHYKMKLASKKREYGIKENGNRRRRGLIDQHDRG